MQSKKLRLLLIRGSAPNGVSYHRLYAPHMRMKSDYDIEVYDCDKIEQVNNDTLRTIDIVIGNRTVTDGPPEQQKFEIDRIKSCGAKFILDLDDYWYLYNNHELSGWWNRNKITSIIEANIRHANYVTVTHDLLGSKTKREYTVIPNGIDARLPQFQVVEKEIEVVEFGWVGSGNHRKDITLMKESLRRLNTEQQPYKMKYCGYNAQLKHCREYEEILSGGWSQHNNYSNIEGQPVDKYGYMYELIDVALIPLFDNEFNNCKSNLKMLEAGFKKKAVIVSDVHPYSPLIKHGVNCLKVNKTDRNGWYKEMMKLIKQPDMVKELAEQLHKDVQAYEMGKINELRMKLYDSIGRNTSTGK